MYSDISNFESAAETFMHSVTEWSDINLLESLCRFVRQSDNVNSATGITITRFMHTIVHDEIIRRMKNGE